MLAVLGAVAVQTEGLVGHELAGAGVDGSTDGDTAMELRQWRADEDCGVGEEGRWEAVGIRLHGMSCRSHRISGNEHTQGPDL